MKTTQQKHDELISKLKELEPLATEIGIESFCDDTNVQGCSLSVLVSQLETLFKNLGVEDCVTIKFN